MKQRVKGFISGLTLAACLFGACIPAMAAARTVIATYSGATIHLNGQQLVGAEPIEIDGTTYLPLRLIGENLNLSVDWNATSKKITLSSKGNSTSDVSDNKSSNTTDPLEAAIRDELENTASRVTEDIFLTKGKYTAGEDFPTGTYDFEALKGCGHIETNTRQIWQGHPGVVESLGKMGDILPEESYMYQQRCKGVELPEGATLTIGGTLKVQMTPSN